MTLHSSTSRLDALRAGAAADPYRAHLARARVERARAVRGLFAALASRLAGEGRRRAPATRPAGAAA